MRFIDAATGYAVRPQIVTGSDKNAEELRISRAQVDQAGRAAIPMKKGRHFLRADAANYKSLAGSVEIAEGSPAIQFILEPNVPPAELSGNRIATLRREDATVILGFVVDDEAGVPLADVNVVANPSGVQSSTDARGFFQMVVPLNEAGAASLTFEKSDYRSEVRQNIELWPKGDWTLQARLLRGSGKIDVMESEVIRSKPAKAASVRSVEPIREIVANEVEVAAADAPVALADVATVRVPSTIRVLLTNGTIDYVSMELYTRRSLSREWIPSWGNYAGGSNSLKAGAVAVRTYAIGYVNNPQSSTNDICATTSCQVYGSTVNSLTDAGVTNTTGYVMVNSANSIPRGLTEYSSENNQLGQACGDGFTAPTGGCLADPVCTGEPEFGHGRGMCQWGTVKWATGKKFPGNSTSNSTLTNGSPTHDWIWIAQHYYPTLTLVQGTPLAIGDAVKVTGTSSLSVRMCGDGSISSGASCPLITTKSLGSTGVIIDGPVQITSDGFGFTWWKIQWNDVDSTIGWSAENWLARTIAGEGPTLATIDDQSIAANATLTLTNSATAPDFEFPLTDFETFASGTVNGTVLFRDPRFSGSTSGFLDASPNLSSVTGTFPTNGNSSTRALRINFNLTNNVNPWIRLTTSATANIPNPVIDFTKRFSFNVYSDKAMKVGLGLRETTTASGTAIGSDGGTSGAIEFVGVPSKNGSAPNPSRSLTASNWATLTFDLPTEPVVTFNAGNGVLSTVSGLGVLEHLALVPTAGTGTYNVYLDNFAVLTPKTLTYSLEPGAPTGATINSSNGVFSWTPTPAQSPSTNTITVRVTDNGSPEQSDLQSFVVIVLSPPSITSEPSSRTNNAGTTATFSVVVTGSEPLSFQWKKGNANLSDGGNVSGATSATLTLANISQSDATNYSVVVTNAAGSDTSSTATLTVIDPPTITIEPESRTNNAGTTATFSITATGTAPLNYQWKKNGANLSNGGNISGVTTLTLTLANVSSTDAANYTIVVTNAAGSDTSATATLTVLAAPVITAQPMSRTNIAGTVATFSVMASGSGPLSYQWRKGDSDLSDGGNVFGAQTATLTLSSVTQSDATNYSVLVTNVAGAIASASATLTVTTSSDNTPPTVTIDSPGNNSQQSVAVVTLSGTAKDTAPGVVVDVKYRLLPETNFTSATTLSVPVNGKITWSATNVTLTPGTNIVHAYSIDAGGNPSALKTNKFFYNSSWPLTVRIAGTGLVKSSTLPNITHNQTISLLVGRPYALTAFVSPGSTNFVFTNWMGGTNLATLSHVSTSAVYSFQMESNLILEANFIPNPFIPVAGTYNGLFSDTNNGTAHHSAGFVTVKVTGKAAYSSKLVFDGDTISGGGKFNLSGQASRIIKRDKKGKSNVNLFLDLDWSSGNQQIRGTVSDGTWTSDILAEKATFNLGNPATDYLGTYTFLVPQTNYPVQPGGFGYGTVTNNLLGIVSLKGGLADGAKIIQKVSLSQDGQWPVYVQMYRSTNLVTNLTTLVASENKANYRGSLMGWVTFTNGDFATNNTLNWIKTSDAETNYFHPAGFTSVVHVIGSPYDPPGTGVRMLNIPTGTVTFANGNLNGPVAYNVSWATNNVISTTVPLNKPTFTLTPKTGLLKGTFQHPQLGKTNYFGAVLQNLNYVGGYFLGTNQPGSMLLDGN